MHNDKDEGISSNTSVSINIDHKLENFFVISEGRLENLEQIAQRIEKYESWEPNWNFDKMTLSGSGAVFLFGLGLLITVWFGGMIMPTTVEIIISSLTLFSLGLLVYCFLNINNHNKDMKNRYNLEAENITTILKKVRASLKNQNNI